MNLDEGPGGKKAVALYFTSQRHYLGSQDAIDAFRRRVRDFFAPEPPGIRVLADAPFASGAVLPVLGCTSFVDGAPLQLVRKTPRATPGCAQLMWTVDSTHGLTEQLGGTAAHAGTPGHAWLARLPEAVSGPLRGCALQRLPAARRSSPCASTATSGSSAPSSSPTSACRAGRWRPRTGSAT